MTRKNRAIGQAIPLLLALSLGLALVGTEVQATNCRVALDFDAEPREYSCDFKTESGNILEGMLLFGDLDGEFFTVDFELDGNTTTVGYCSCKTRASFRAAQFGASRSFSCVTPLEAGSAESMEGQLSGNGKKIRKGHVLSALSDGNGGSDLLRLRFECKSDKAKNKNSDD